jgi:hypothetical protein
VLTIAAPWDTIILGGSAMAESQQDIPFPLVLDKSGLNKKINGVENAAKKAVDNKVKELKAGNIPVALYDAKRKRPYLEYPDGRKKYDLESIRALSGPPKNRYSIE